MWVMVIPAWLAGVVVGISTAALWYARQALIAVARLRQELTDEVMGGTAIQETPEGIPGHREQARGGLRRLWRGREGS